MNPDITPAAREAFANELEEERRKLRGHEHKHRGHHVQLALNATVAQAKEVIARLTASLNHIRRHKSEPYCAEYANITLEELALSQQPNQTGGESCTQSENERNENQLLAVPAETTPKTTPSITVSSLTPAAPSTVASKGADPDVPSVTGPAPI